MITRIAEFIWWGLPCLLIIIIGGLTWHRTYQLDPFKPLDPTKSLKDSSRRSAMEMAIYLSGRKNCYCEFCAIPSR